MNTLRRTLTTLPIALPLLSLGLVAQAQPPTGPGPETRPLNDYQTKRLNASLKELDACTKHLQALFEQALKDTRKLVATADIPLDPAAQKKLQTQLTDTYTPLTAALNTATAFAALTVMEKLITGPEDPGVPFATALLCHFYKCTPQEVANLYVAKGLPFSSLAVAMALGKASNTPFATLVDQHDAGKSWTEVAATLKLDPAQLQQIFQTANGVGGQ